MHFTNNFFKCHQYFRRVKFIFDNQLQAQLINMSWIIRYIRYFNICWNDYFQLLKMIEGGRQELYKLQSKHKQMLNTRKQLLQSLRFLKKRERYCKDELLHRPGLLSRGQSTQSVKEIQAPYEEKEGEEKHQKKKKPQNKPVLNIKQESITSHLQMGERQRNKRTIGLVSSYLLKAKDNLQSQEQKKKLELERKVRQKEEEDVRHMKEERLIVIMKQKEQVFASKNALAQELLDIQNEILICKYKNHLNSFEGFATKTQPNVFWKPCKPFQSTRPQEDSKLYFKSELQRVQKLVKSNNDTEKYGKSIVEEKRNYYQSIKAHYLQKQHSFIATQVSPPIYWRPYKHTNLTSALEKATKIKLIDEANKPVPELLFRGNESDDQDSEGHSQKHDL